MVRILKNHYVLAVADAAETARYFVDVLGFEHQPVGDEGWRFVVKNDSQAYYRPACRGIES